MRRLLLSSLSSPARGRWRRRRRRGRGRLALEGGSSLDRYGRDLADHIVEVREHFAGWVSEDVDVLGPQPGVTGCVSLGSVAVVVGLAVDFNREAGWGAVKV